MTVGMSSAWRSKQPKQKRCDRCNLYYPEALETCLHCSDLNSAQLTQLKANHQKYLEHNSNLGKYLFIIAAIIGVFLLLSFF